ncbi:MAG: type II toxin-antitoxin system Phd/YefM family antitoxin [Sphingomicrobium sp.]
MRNLAKAASSDVSKRFGFWYDEAMTHPVEIERNSVVRVIMMPASEYHRLARLDHIALAPTELSANDIRAIRDAGFRSDDDHIEVAATG